jgi:hypothetical protein
MQQLGGSWSIQNNVELPSEGGLKDVNELDVKELLQSDSKSLTDDKLRD